MDSAQIIAQLNNKIASRGLPTGKLMVHASQQAVSEVRKYFERLGIHVSTRYCGRDKTYDILLSKEGQDE